MNARKEFISLHYLKVICSLLVVILHVPPLSIRVAVLPLCRIAVPMFLLISGFFVIQDRIITRTKTTRAIVKIGKLIIVSNLVYFCYSCLASYINCNILIPSHFKSATFWIEQLIIGSNLCGPLWYLSAYFESLVLIYLLSLCPVKVYDLSKKISPVLLIIFFLTRTYDLFSFSPGAIVSHIILVLFFCCPMLLLGSCLRELPKSSNSKNIVTALIFSLFAIAYSELYVFHYYGKATPWYPASSIMLAVCLFYYVINWEIPLTKNNTLSRVAVFISKECSLYVYIYHVLIYDVLCSAIKGETWIRDLFCNSIMTFFIVILISTSIKFIKNKI